MKHVFAAGIALAMAVWSGPAHAASIGADLDLALPNGSRVSSGWGIGGRLGTELHVPFVALTPEIALSYYHLGGTFAPNIYQAKGGARVTFGELIRPGAFGHVGLGVMNPEVTSSKLGFGWDAGILLDFAFIPFFTFGAHAGYNALSVGPSTASSTRWWTLGAQASLVF